jgi:hypothetical protein
MKKRGHYIHEVMAAGGPMTPEEIGREAEVIARLDGYPVNPATFSAQTTRNHLTYLKKRGYTEQLEDRSLWQLTDRARRRIERGRGADDSAFSPLSSPSQIVRTVDEKGRLLLPKEYANATVMLDLTTESEIRIRKAVLIPEAELPLVENQLRPLSDRDRDFFLNLLDNPPEPTPALRTAAAKYKKRHG